MARKGRRAPPKRASAAPADPMPAPDSDAHISATAPLEDVATSPGESRDPTLSTDTVLADADPVGAEKTPVSSETAEPSPAKDPLLPSEEAAPASAPVKATPSSLEPPSPWDAAPSELLSFPAGFSLPPIPSTSTAMAGPSAPEAQSYTPAEVKAWRNQQIDAKQAELSAVVDKHDDYVRELFHLDRFVTLIGYDPVVAKTDRSDVFQLFQANYDLFLNAAPEGSASAGGRRGTRRATTDRKVSALAAGADMTSSRRKGKAKAEGEDDDSWSTREESVRPGPKNKGLTTARGKKASGSPSSAGARGSPSPAPSASRNKKRPSIASTPSRAGSQAPYLFSVPPEGQTPYEPVVANMEELPNMLKHDLPPLSPRAVKRRKLILDSGVTYTHPTQVPPDPQFDFSLTRLLESYMSLEDDVDIEPPLPEEELDARAEYELEVLDQVDAIRAEGRELYDPDRTAAEEPKRAKDHQEWLVEHALHFSHLVAQERKAHIALARKTARMVTKHFDEIRGREDREQKEIERNQKALARWTLREVRKKWKLATGVVRARFKEEQKAEQKRLGKQQLDLMLNKSTTMLQAQQLGMAGDFSDSERDPDRSDASYDDDEEEEEEEAEEEGNQEEEEEGGGEGPAEEEGGDEHGLEKEPGADGEDAAIAEASASVADVSSAPLRPRRGSGRRRAAASGPKAESSEEAVEEDDSGDAVFAAEAEDTEQRAEEDDQYAAEMEKDDESDHDEMANLAAEADMPIEELLRRSGYAAMLAEEQSMPDEAHDSAGGAAAVPESTEMSAQSSNVAPSPSTPGTSAEAGIELTAEEKEADAMSEFGSEPGEDQRDEEDQQFEQEMNAEQGESDDEEMKGLAEDADLPIEELMAKYGYGPPAGTETSAKHEGPKTEAVETPNLDGDEVKPEPDQSAAGTSAAHNDDADGKAVEKKAHEAEDEEGEEDAEQEAEEVEELDGASGGKGDSTGLGPDRQVVHFKPPFLLRASLRPYQQAGLEWLASLYTSGVNGILADEMGLGKTIQTISLLAHLACDKGQWGPHLVVVPTSVMLNWEMEFRKFLPGFKLLTYYGTQKERKEKRKGWNTENAFNVCITSYQLVLADQYIFRRKPWHYLILDEAHHIKNFRSQRWQTLLGFNARHRLLLTGTPLQNNLMELWSLLYFLMPQGLAPDGNGPFAGHSDFQAWFSNPMDRAIESGEAMDAETQATVNQLHTILRPYLLRRLKAEVETQMPGKTESVIYCRMSKRQRYLYDDFMSRAQTRDTLSSGHFLSIINCLMQLRKVCNHPDLFEVRPIVTSFSMQRSVVSGFEPSELLVRKRLLEDEPIASMDWSTLTLVKPWQEETTTTVASQVRMALDASAAFPYLHQVPVDVDLYNVPPQDTKSIAGWRKYETWREHRATLSRLDRLATINRRRCIASTPYFGADLLRILREPSRRAALLPTDTSGLARDADRRPAALSRMVLSNEQRASTLDDTMSTFAFATPAVRAHDMARHALPGMTQDDIDDVEEAAPAELLHLPSTKLTVAFPDRSLLQYDCGKLQKLDELLRECKAGGHRALIFTQMTKVLDILEEFLSYQGYRYLRLDGSTKIEQRQTLTERFNSNDKILCFISSTRAGGLGINLQGADTVIFYDSDWNPALDRQCQDRAHRIGQTREVRIWRFVTEHSIEENMLRKANQKRKLDQMVIAEGDFTTDHLQRLDWRDYLDESQLAELGVDGEAAGDGVTGAGNGATQSAAEIRQALAAAEDVEDAAAAKAAINELEVDRGDFAGEGQQASGSAATIGKDGLVNTAADGQKEEEEDPLAGTVDGVMIRWVEEDWEYFRDA